MRDRDTATEPDAALQLEGRYFFSSAAHCHKGLIQSGGLYEGHSDRGTVCRQVCGCGWTSFEPDRVMELSVELTAPCIGSRSINHFVSVFITQPGMAANGSKNMESCLEHSNARTPELI